MTKEEFEVVWTDSARVDLLDTSRYIGSSSTGTSKKALLKIRQAAEGLASFPNSGRVVFEVFDYWGDNYREVVVLRWRLIYRLDGERVFVIALLDARRNIADVLFNRLTSSES